MRSIATQQTSAAAGFSPQRSQDMRRMMRRPHSTGKITSKVKGGKVRSDGKK